MNQKINQKIKMKYHIIDNYFIFRTFRVEQFKDEVIAVNNKLQIFKFNCQILPESICLKLKKNNNIVYILNFNDNFEQWIIQNAKWIYDTNLIKKYKIIEKISI